MNLPTKPRHPMRVKMCSELHGDMQNLRIKSLRANRIVICYMAGLRYCQKWQHW
jgi:hypothetical protein